MEVLWDNWYMWINNKNVKYTVNEELYNLTVLFLRGMWTVWKTFIY